MDTAAIRIFLSTFAVVLLSEMGDKTQIATVLLAGASPLYLLYVALGSAMALISTSFLEVCIGSQIIARFFKPSAIRTLSAFTFLILGVLLIAGLIGPGEVILGHHVSGNDALATKFLTWLTTYTLIILCELGDKTQVAVLMFSSNRPTRKWLVFGASALALATCVAIEVTVGSSLARYVGVELINKATGLVFVAIGLVTLGLFNLRPKLLPPCTKTTEFKKETDPGI